MAFDVTRQEILKQANDLLRLYKQTRDQKYKDEENRLRRIVAELETIVIGGGGGTQDLQDVTDLGSTTTNAIDTGGITTDYVQLDTAATPALQTGMFAWNDVDGTADLRLKGGNVTLQVGQETVVRVVNKTGANLLESQYKVVRVRLASEGGAQGQRLAVVLAQGDNDPDSATTLGIVTENIDNNQEGFITVFGNVNKINTTGSLQGETWVDGDVLYLSPTTPGALTKVKPQAPQHTLIVGYVVYAHANQGKIFVKVDNGYELDELHNVLISSPTDGQVLKYNQSLGVWENGDGGSVLYTKTLVAYRTMLQPSGTFMDLSLDGTGVTGLIEPSVPNATWNVTIDTIATVINVIGDAPGMSIGDTYSETTRLVFKRIGGISTLVAIVSSEAGFDASMTTALMNYSVGGSQNLNLQFQFPTFAGAGSVQINAISKLEIVEATY
jgi:hypothetical protein